MKQKHLSVLEETISQLQKLCMVQREGEEQEEERPDWVDEIAKWKALLKQYTEAYDQVAKKVHLHSHVHVNVHVHACSCITPT